MLVERGAAQTDGAHKFFQGAPRLVREQVIENRLLTASRYRHRYVSVTGTASPVVPRTALYT